MRTFQRLMKAYNRAEVRTIDETSRYVFMSDVHRGNGGISDEFSKNRNTYIYALNEYYKRGFTYVEVGDGDELWEANHMNVIQEAHTDAVAAIKQFFDDDRMIMMYGNHNMDMRKDEYVRKHYDHYYNRYTEEQVDLFPGLEVLESLILKQEDTGQEIFVVHGHQGDVANDQLWFLTMLSLKYFWRHFRAFGIKSPASPIKNIFKRHKIERNYIKWIVRNRMALICGHTHRFKYPKTNELPYFNTGCCVYPTTITALELENNMLSLIRWKVLVNDEGINQVRRMVLQGPRPIEEFDLRKMDTSEIEAMMDASYEDVRTSKQTIEGQEVNPDDTV